MQFRLRFLFAVVTYLSVILALVFAAPPIIAWPLLSLLLLVSPAVWIAGIVYARGAWRAFFIGGTAAGIGPFVTTSLITLMYAVDAVPPLVRDWSNAAANIGDRWTAILVSCFMLSSGPIAMLGGLLGCSIYWCFRSEPSVTRGSIEAE